MGGSWGNVNIKGMKQLQKKLQKIQQSDLDTFYRACAKELAARLLRSTIRRTPVGKYGKEVEVTAKKDSKHHKKGDVYKKWVNQTGKTGGTLRRGWTSGTQAEAAQGKGGGAKNIDAFLQNVQVTHTGDMYQITIKNPVEYASYVEYGHRTRSHKGWVQGRFMLTISMQELESKLPAILEQKLYNLLKGVF